jgi:AhpD family alkylhydroperoxidase
MEQRLNFYKASPNATKVLMVLETALHKLSIEPLLVDLVKLRASQINGCAYCVDMHTRDARKKGETERRLYGVSVWHETPFFTPRERAAFAWTEALTRLPDTGAPDEDYATMRAEFSEQESVDLTLIIGAINVWNRFGVGYRMTLPD